MVPEQADRMTLGWSREDLAQYSGVSIASVYLMERSGSSTEGDDARIRDALARGLAEKSRKKHARKTELSSQGSTVAPTIPSDLDAIILPSTRRDRRGG